MDVGGERAVWNHLIERMGSVTLKRYQRIANPVSAGRDPTRQNPRAPVQGDDWSLLAI